MQISEIELTEINLDKKPEDLGMIVVNENGSVTESLDNDDWEKNLLSSNESDNNSENEEKIVQSTGLPDKSIYLVDIVFSAFVSSPISGFFWYTIWKFTEDYVFIYSQNMSYFLTYFTGFLVLSLAYILQDCFQKLFSCLTHLKYFNKILCFLMRNIYMYVITVAVTIEWQGLWDLIESNIDDLQTKLSLSVIAITYACLTRSTRALVSTPFILTIDEDEGFFEYELKSHSIFENSIFANFVLSEIIDCLVMVVGWIGFDNLYDYYFDSYLSPDISIKSLTLTFSISHITYFIVVILQCPIHRFMENKDIIFRIIVEHIVNIVMFISSILLWKFYWDLGDYISSDFETKPKLQIFLIGNLLLFIIGVLLKITWVLPGPGVITFDGDNSDRDAYFQIDYFATLLKSSNERNLLRNRRRSRSLLTNSNEYII